MELPLSEIIDRLTILKLKIERVGEPHLNNEYAKWNEALQAFQQRDSQTKKEWFNTLYEINRRDWDLDADLRKIVASAATLEHAWKIAEEKLGFAEVGRRAQIMAQLAKERTLIKNKIVEETGAGFTEIKKDY